jgi:hypothetical protein
LVSLFRFYRFRGNKSILQAGNHNRGGRNSRCEYYERANYKASHSINVFDCDIVALALDSAEQIVVLGVYVNSVIRFVHIATTCANA